MTIQALKRKKQELLASQVSRIASDTNENLLRVNLSKFFTDLEHEIQSALLEYWNDHMLLQGPVNLILASIHEKHQEYYELIMKHKLQEFHRAEQLGKRLVKRQEQSAMKATKPVKITANKDNLFGTLQYSEDRLAQHTFTASQNTLNRVDSNINEILLDGYKSGVGINEVSRQITERFDQLRTWEAKRIARTEIHTAQNMGIMSSYESLGVEYTQWITTHDGRVRGLRKGDRADHVKMDREIIPFGGTYSNGLAFPGDTSGPIEEWINCRCSNAPFVMPAGMMAPSFSPFKESDLIPLETINPLEQIGSEAAVQQKPTFDKTPFKKDEDRTLEIKQDNLQRKVKFPKLLKEAMKFWGGTGYKMINSRIYKRGFIAKLPGTDPIIKKIDKMIKKMDEAIDMAPRLAQDTILYRQGHFSGKLQVGKVYGFKGYTSCSYDEDVIDAFSGQNRYKIEIYAPKGTKGIRINEQFDGATDEREFLLGRKQRFEVLEVDEKNKTAKIRLIVE